MNQEFEAFVNDHIQDLLCELEKEHSLKLLKLAQTTISAPRRSMPVQKDRLPEVLFQDCAVESGFSSSHL